MNIQWTLDPPNGFETRQLTLSFFVPEPSSSSCELRCTSRKANLKHLFNYLFLTSMLSDDAETNCLIFNCYSYLFLFPASSWGRQEKENLASQPHASDRAVKTRSVVKKSLAFLSRPSTRSSRNVDLAREPRILACPGSLDICRCGRGRRVAGFRGGDR